MPDAPDTSHDLNWYRSRWEELTEILSTSEPDAVVAQVRELQLDALQEQTEALADAGVPSGEQARELLQRVHRKLKELREENRALQAIRDRLNADSGEEAVQAVDRLRAEVETLRDQLDDLDAAGVNNASQVLAMIDSMEQQLKELYSEKESAERSEQRAAEVAENGDTFEQLQALLAREEKLRRELGVASSDEVIEMVHGLAEQLEDLYAQQGPGGDGASTINQLERLLSREEQLQDELGVSAPDEVAAMVEGLSTQLEELYASRERLQEINLDDADSVVDMVSSMQAQLETLYESQERMAERGIHSVDHAINMIDSMEAQLTDLYDERARILDQGVDDPAEATERLERMQEQMDALAQEREALLQRRDALHEEKQTYEDTVDTLVEEFGSADPEHIAKMIHSMEEQLQDMYRDRDLGDASVPDAHDASGPATQDAGADTSALNAQAAANHPDDALVDWSTCQTLDRSSREDLDALPVGAFALDDRGVIVRVNDDATGWPSVDARRADALVGRNFFFDVAPGTNNGLVRGRYLSGIRDGHMDVRISYAYIGGPNAPVRLDLHLYRARNASVTWLFFRRP